MKKLLLSMLMTSSFVINAQTPIQEFKFDGNLLNTAFNITFIGNSTFVSDRFSDPNKAIRLANSDLEAVIDNLPQNNLARSVSIWVKFNDVSDANYLWGYGMAYNSQYFGLIHQAVFNATSNLSLAGWGPSNDMITKVDLATKIWFNYVVTFDGINSKIYRNGELITSGGLPERFTKGTVFRLGKINTVIGVNADVDDLKIYDLALTSEQVANLYLKEKPSAVSNQSLAQKAGILNKTTPKAKSIQNSSANKVGGVELVSLKPKEIEIFSQGQKVLGSNKAVVNITELPEGTYLLKITNTSGTVTSSN